MHNANAYRPNADEKLVRDFIGHRHAFVRAEELLAAWKKGHSPVAGVCGTLLAIRSRHSDVAFRRNQGRERRPAPGPVALPFQPHPSQNCTVRRLKNVMSTTAGTMTTRA